MPTTKACSLGALVALALVIAGCRTIPEGRFACADDAECPPGTTCAEDRCWASPPIIEGCGDPATRPRVEVSSAIEADTSWTCDTIWELTAEIDVRARLTIEPGTRVLGRSGGGVLVRPDGVLVARGTVEAPIVFTGHAGSAPGEWHGITMLGSAPTNDPAATWMSVSTPFGGADPTHRCGELDHVRIELAGQDRHNALTLAGCGTGTLVSYVQVHRSGDEGITVLGGTTNLDHVVITGPTWDALDWALGWTGRVQFLVTQHYQHTMGRALSGGNRDPADSEPRSRPVIYNATLFGGGTESGAVSVTAGSWIVVSSSVILGFGGFAVDATSDESYAGIATGDVSLDASILHEIGPDGATYTDAADPNDAMILGALNTHEDPGITSLDPFDPRPAVAMGPTATGAARPPPGFENVSYRGALRHGDTWLDGWTVGLPTSGP